MDETLAGVCSRVRETFPERVSEPEEAFGEVSLRVDRARIADVCAWLRDEGPFQMLADLSGVDFLGINPPAERFLVAYHLYSFTRNARLRLRVFVPEGDETVPSVTGVWPTASWHEREVYDFFGIAFSGHPDLRRILMPDDWEGHPHRKDYPLGGVKVQFKGALVPPPDHRSQPTTTTGYPGRIA